MNFENQSKRGTATEDVAGQMQKEDGEMRKHNVLFATERISGPGVSLQPAVVGGGNVSVLSAEQTERMAVIGQGVTGIAHAVKNMLNGLRGGVYIMKNNLDASGVEVNGRAFEMLENNLGRLQELVGDMLTFSKEREPDYACTDLNELVRMAEDVMQADARERRVRLRFHACEGLREVEVDVKAIYRCVLDLISNALDACAGVEGAHVDVSVLSGGPYHVVIQVKDQGCGMDEDTLRSIFQPFFSTKSSRGTGLGLSMTRKIVQEHGGTVDVVSHPGEGSMFRIRLPRRRWQPWPIHL